MATAPRNSLSPMQDALVASRNREEIAILDIPRRDPDTAAVIAKAETSNRRRFRYNEKGELQFEVPNQYSFLDKAGDIVSRIIAAKHLRQMLTDIELISQILTSSILAPKDFLTTELSHYFDESILSAKLNSSVKGRIEDFFEDTYPIKSRLYTYLDDILFNTGSKPLLVLPENVIDDIINGSAAYNTESLTPFINAKGDFKPLNILGRGKVQSEAGLSLEAAKGYETAEAFEEVVFITTNDNDAPFDSGVRITDNFNILKSENLKAVADSARTQSILTAQRGRGLSNESSSKTQRFNLNDEQIIDLIYQSRNKRTETIKVVKTQSQLNRYSATEGLILELPSEAVRPIATPGNVEKHVAFILLLDEFGNPLTKDMMPNLTPGLMEQHSNSSFTKNLIAKTKLNMIGGSFNCQNKDHAQAMLDVYESMVEADLVARWRNGSNQRSIRLAGNQEIYRIMLARKLEGSNTRMLWIPKELMTYMAIDYDDDGVGISLLIRNETVGAMRAGLIYADINAAIKNSVGLTNYDITLDPEDPNPERTVEQVMGLAMTMARPLVPLTAMGGSDLADYVKRGSMNFKFTGNDKIPEMTIDKSESSASYERPDPELLRFMQEYFVTGFSITPDMLDLTKQPELASVAFQRNALLTKRVVQIQEILNPQITDHHRIVMRHHEGLITDLRTMLEENFEEIELSDKLIEMAKNDPKVKDHIIRLTIDDIIDSYSASLAQPELASNESKIVELDGYNEIIERRLDSIFGETDSMNEVYGEMAGQMGLIRSVLKSVMLGREMDRMSMGTEIQDLLRLESGEVRLDGVLEEHSDIMKLMINSVSKLYMKNKEFKDQSNRAAEALQAGDPVDAGGSDSFDSGADDGSGSEGGDPDFGDFDDMDDGTNEDGSLEETPTDDLGEEEPQGF